MDNVAFPPEYSHPKLKAVTAGGITGALELMISYPIDYTKTQLQLAKRNSKGVQTFREVIKTTIERRGVAGLYRGLPVVLMFAIPRESTRFGVYETLKQLTVDQKGTTFPAYMGFFCGLGAGICEAIFMTIPSETIKVKLVRDQLEDHPKYKGIFTDGIFKIVKEQGIKGIYQGFTVTLMKTGSNQAIRFYVVEKFKFRYRREDPSIKVPSLIVGMFGIVAGLTSVLINNPIDVMKTRMQGYGAANYKNTLDCAKKIYKEEGFPTFYRGMRARMLRVAIDAGFTFMCYDTIASLLEPFFDAAKQ